MSKKELRETITKSVDNAKRIVYPEAVVKKIEEKTYANQMDKFIEELKTTCVMEAELIGNHREEYVKYLDENEEEFVDTVDSNLILIDNRSAVVPILPTYGVNSVKDVVKMRIEIETRVNECISIIVGRALTVEEFESGDYKLDELPVIGMVQSPLGMSANKVIKEFGCSEELFEKVFNASWNVYIDQMDTSEETE